MVLGAELPEVRSVASKTFSVDVAGHAVVGTGLAGGSGLTVESQLLETLLNTGIALSEVSHEVAGRTESS